MHKYRAAQSFATAVPAKLMIKAFGDDPLRRSSLILRLSVWAPERYTVQPADSDHQRLLQRPVEEDTGFSLRNSTEFMASLAGWSIGLEMASVACGYVR